MNTWNFKIELESAGVFDRLSDEYGFDFPLDLQKFIIENNGASPEEDCVEINGVERVYDETLSFNEAEEEATTVFDVMKSIDNDDYVPFARDPFGNYFCYSVEKGTISFYDHEEDRIEDTDLSLEEFIKSLH